MVYVFFFFKQKTAYEMRISDWSSAVCSSELTQFHQVRMTEHGCAVETDLCIQHDQLAIVSNGKRIDLDLRRISADEGVIERLCYLRCLLGEIAGQVQRLCDRTAVVRHQACGRVDGQRMDLFRRVVRHILNVHAAFGGGDESHPPACAINQQSQIEFLGDIHAVSHIKAVDLLARFSGLHRNEGRSEERRVGKECVSTVRSRWSPYN